MIHKIKALHDEGNGLGIRAIARQLGISRNTVKKYLRMEEEAIHQQQTQRERSKRLDDHREYIISLLGQFPGLSAVKILRKLRERHPQLEVSDRSARRYIGELKGTVTLKQPRYYEPVLDMEPGVQCQVDGGELRNVLIGGVESVIYFVVFVLSYSRLMYVGLSREPVDTEAFIRMHDEAFRYFGGRPEECVYDQAKLVVLHEQYRELQLNQRFHAYATAAGFRIHACEGYDPESKGKVEAGVKYVKQDGLYGETFNDWKHVEQHLAQWLEATANVRIHGSTGEQPIQRHERDERAQLGAYLTPAYLTQTVSPQETRKVDKTGLLCWQSNKYSAPLAYQQARVGVRIEGAQLVLSDLESGAEIARHGLCLGKGQVIKNNDHYRDKRARIDELEGTIRERLGEASGAALCALLKQTNPKIYKDQLVGVKALLARHEMPEALLAKLLDRPALTATRMREYLEAYAADPQRLHPSPSPAATGSQGYKDAALSRYANLTEAQPEVDHATLH